MLGPSVRVVALGCKDQVHNDHRRIGHIANVVCGREHTMILTGMETINDINTAYRFWECVGVRFQFMRSGKHIPVNIYFMKLGLGPMFAACSVARPIQPIEFENSKIVFISPTVGDHALFISGMQRNYFNLIFRYWKGVCIRKE
jgi:hypothetical protein